MDKSPDAFRTISEVADWLGIQAHVLRFWESKFTQVKPVKRAGGRRYYRPADMMLLGGIKKLLHEDGMTIKGVQKVLREQGVGMVSELSQSLDDVAVSASRPRRAQTVVPFEQRTSVLESVRRERDADGDSGDEAGHDAGETFDGLPGDIPAEGEVIDTAASPMEDPLGAEPPVDMDEPLPDPIPEAEPEAEAISEAEPEAMPLLTFRRHASARGEAAPEPEGDAPAPTGAAPELLPEEAATDDGLPEEAATEDLSFAPESAAEVPDEAEAEPELGDAAIPEPDLEPEPDSEPEVAHEAEPEPESAPQPRPRIVDAPDPPAESEIEAAPGLLSLVAGLERLSEDRREEIAALARELDDWRSGQAGRHAAQ